MKTTSFLRSVIADARPRRPRLESGNPPAAPGWTEPPVAMSRGDIYPGQAATDWPSATIPIIHRLNPMDGLARPEGSPAAPADVGPAARQSAGSGAVHDFPAASGPQTTMVYDPAPDTTDGPAAGWALPVKGPEEAGGPRPGPETVLPSNEITRSDPGAGPQMDFGPQPSSPAGGQDALEPGPAVSPEPIENLEPADRNPSGQEPQPGSAAPGSRLSGTELPRPETAVQLAAVAEKAGPENTDGGQSREVPAQGGDRDARSPAAVADPAKPGGDAAGAVMSGPGPAPAGFPRRPDAPESLDHRRGPQTPAIESERPATVAGRTRPAGRPHGPTTPAAPLLPPAVSGDSVPPVKAAAGNIAAPKAAAALERPVNPAEARDRDPGPLPPSSATEAKRDNTSTRMAAQARTAPIRAEVLPGNPRSRNPVRPAAGTARGTSFGAAAAPQVKIGQVDVFIEAPHSSHKPRPSPPPTPHSLASRHYLRRL